MSRNLSRHSGVSCDACGKSSFSGKRYKCLTCYDFDLCSDCYESGETGTSRHSTSHPMQCILTRVESELYFGGEPQVLEAPQSFTCPLCGQIGLSETQLKDHVTKKHAESTVLQEVICPVCAAYPNGDPNHLTDDLPTHLTVEHRALEQDMGTQNRVRRLIGRRRAGLDRYIGVLSREVGSGPQEGIDPIAELLSQLSGPNSGGGGSGGAVGNSGASGSSGRRLISEFPPHIQQLLDQQERQTFERGSPMRRPVYRKLVTSGGLPPSINYDSSLPTYLLPGHPLESPQPPKGVAESRGLLVEPVLRETERSGTKTDKESPYLLASYNLPEPSEEEKVELAKKRTDKSMFVQELLLSTLAYLDTSSSSEDSDSEHT